MKATLLILSFLIIGACSQVEKQVSSDTVSGYYVSPSDKYVYVDGTRFMKPGGTPFVINAINIGYTFHEENETWTFDLANSDFQDIYDMGFNTVRLNFAWSQLEPECGLIDSAFVNDLKEYVSRAEKSDLFVILGMRQFLWGKGIPEGYGAPGWALLKKDTVHKHSGYHPSTAYVESPLIHTAFDNFWGNQKAEDGIGLIDHYASAWKYMAQTFAEDSMVIGYHIINNPSLGSPVAELTKKAVRNRKMALALDVVPVWRLTDFQLYYAALKDVEKDTSVYRDHWLDAFNPSIKRMEDQWLMPFYTIIGEAIRTEDNSHILFTEMSRMANEGADTGIRRIVYKSGNPETLQAVSSNIYGELIDLVHFKFERHHQAASRNVLPLMVGEWGNLGNEDNFYDYDPVPAAKMLADTFKFQNVSSAYWQFKPGLESESYFKVIKNML